MSTSKGNPSNKIPWYQKMMAKFDYQEKLLEEASKVAKNPGYKPKITIGKKNKKLFDNLVVECKEHKKLDKSH